MAKEDRGFASMDRAKQREIASKGGKAAHQKGTAHEWTSEEARDAGRKGGIASHRRRREQMGGNPGGRRATRPPTRQTARHDGGAGNSCARSTPLRCNRRPSTATTPARHHLALDSSPAQNPSYRAIPDLPRRSAIRDSDRRHAGCGRLVEDRQVLVRAFEVGDEIELARAILAVRVVVQPAIDRRDSRSPPARMSFHRWPVCIRCADRNTSCRSSALFSHHSARLRHRNDDHVVLHRVLKRAGTALLVGVGVHFGAGVLRNAQRAVERCRRRCPAAAAGAPFRFRCRRGRYFDEICIT